MVKSEAKTVQEYLDSLPEDRREIISTIRQLVLANLPAGYQESINWGMIAYEIPLERYPVTYNKQPLMYAALAAQKNYNSLYLLNVYGNPQKEAWLAEQFKLAGKKIKLGKSCLQFKKVEDLPLEAIGQVIASTTPEELIQRYEQVKRKKDA